MFAKTFIDEQVLSAHPGMLSGPDAFQGFIFLRVFATSHCMRLQMLASIGHLTHHWFGVKDLKVGTEFI